MERGKTFYKCDFLTALEWMVIASFFLDEGIKKRGPKYSIGEIIASKRVFLLNTPEGNKVLMKEGSKSVKNVFSL